MFANECFFIVIMLIVIIVNCYNFPNAISNILMSYIIVLSNWIIYTEDKEHTNY